VQSIHTSTTKFSTELEMWANAQRDGRPAEYRWCPLLNAAVWLTPTTRVPCSKAAQSKTRNPFKLPGTGVPQTNETISKPLVGRSSPYCEDIWRRYFCLTSFFSDCRYVPQLRRYSPTKLCDGAQMAIFGDFFGCCICSEPRAAHFRPAL